MFVPKAAFLLGGLSALINPTFGAPLDAEASLFRREFDPYNGNTWPEPLDIRIATVDWFLEHIIRHPRTDHCLFYTRRIREEDFERLGGLSHPAYCNGGEFDTIWNLWPDSYDTGVENSFYSMFERGSWLRNIASSARDRNLYFERMSAAFALACVGRTYVMTEDIHNIPGEGIFTNIEEPTLYGNPNVFSLAAIGLDLNINLQRTLFIGPDLDLRVRYDGIEERDTSTAASDPAQLQARSGKCTERTGSGVVTGPGHEPSGSEFFGSLWEHWD